MNQNQLTNILLDQSKDLIWMVNKDFQLVYANKSFLNSLNTITGIKIQLNESIFVDEFDSNYIERWRAYYIRAFNGEYFDVEEHYFNPIANEIQYGQITFEPIKGEDQKIFLVGCQSKDITHIVKLRSESNQLINSTLDIFCTINEQSLFVYVSAASTKHWGYQPEELIGKAFQDFIVNEDLSKTNDIAADILNGKEIKSFVNRYKKKDGSIAYNIWSARWDSDAKLMYCVARDGREKIEQEEKIVQSEQRFKALVKDSYDLITITDINGNYTFVSSSSTAITGYDPEEFMGKNAFDFIHPQDAERALASMAKLATQNSVVIEPFRTKHKNNEWRWAETVLTNMLDNPAVNGILGNTRDITERIEEQQRLKLLESVITNTNDAILITDAEPIDEPGPKIIYVNDAFTKMTGYTAEEVIGKTPRILQGPNSNKEELAKLSLSMRKWEPCELTTINYKKNGDEFWINFSLNPVANEKGWYTHWIAIEREVTEQKTKELESELLAKISINFNSENKYLVALKELCKTITEFGKFDWVELWTANLEKTHVNLLSYYLLDPDDEKFYDSGTKINTIKYSESLAGKVWSEGKVLLWDTSEIDEHFVRRGAAKIIGLKAILGIPLIFNDEVIGVLKVGSKSGVKYLARYTELFKHLEEYIGSELNRKKLEDELSHLFDSIPDILCVTDFNGKFLKINKAACKLLGYREDEILYHNFNEFVHPADLNISTKELQRNGQDSSTHEFENRYITKNGEIVWLSWVCNSSVKEGLVYSTAKNITEEMKLRELNRETRSLAKIGSWEFNLLKHEIYWSEEVHQMHETDYKSFVPTFEESINFYREDYRQIVQTHIEKCIATAEPFDFEAVFVTTKKNELWVRSIGNAEFKDGVCIRIFGSFQDINDRKQVEERLLSLADNLPCVVYQYFIYPDGSDSLKYVTKGANAVWGFDYLEVINNNQLVWDQIAAGGEIEKVKRSIKDSINKKSKWTGRWKYKMPTGEIKTHLGYGTPNFLSDGTILFNSVILDITEEARNEDLLEEVTKLATIGSWEIDLLHNKSTWSTMVHSILETDPNKYIPNMDSMMSFYREDFRNIAHSSIQNCIIKGIHVDFEAIITTQNKNEKWVRLLGNAELIDGKPIRIYGSIQDIHERKFAEEKLIQSEQKYRQLAARLELQQVHLTNAQEIARLGSWETQLPSLKVLWSDETFRIFGTTKENFEPSHENFLNCIHPLDREKVAKAFSESTLNTNESNNIIEHRILTPSGELKVVEERWNVSYDEKGIPILALGTCQDITDRKLAEQERETLIVTLENSLNEIYIFDAKNLKFIYVNKGALLNLGYSDIEIKSMTPLDLKPSQTKATFDNLLNPLYNNEKDKIVFFTNHKRKNGSLYPVEVHLQLVKVGISKRFVAIILDISERKNAEEGNKFKANLLNMMGQAAIATDLEGVVNYWNNAAENIYGWKREEAIGINIMKLTTPDTSIEHAKMIMDKLKKGQSWTGEFLARKKDGTNFQALITNSPIIDEDNTLSGIIGISSDITQETKTKELIKQYTLELERSNEELEQFAFVASHDLQEPLRMISSFMDLLQKKYGDRLDEKGHQYVHFAIDGAKRMKQIILDLLDYSRASRITEEKAEVNLQEVLADFMLLRRKIISEKNATINVNNLPIIQTYQAVITQIFHCLIDNALKYSFDDVPPIVEVNAIENELEWEFSVKDNGIGIDRQFFDKIFVIFQRLHNKDKYPGTGIGLSIAKRHIEFLGGSIWLESVLGKGSEFHFTISKNK